MLPAVHDTIERWQLPSEHFEAFLDACGWTSTVTEYAPRRPVRYMYGSAAVIGLQMLPVLGRSPGVRDVAAALRPRPRRGFQLTNFIRDVGEDLRRGRVYLPMDDLEAASASPATTSQQGVVDASLRRLLAFEIARAREIFRSAAPGRRLLDPTSRDCIRTATTLYGGILDEVEKADYRVLDRRVARAAHPAAQRRGARSRTGPRRPKNTHQHKRLRDQREAEQQVLDRRVGEPPVAEQVRRRRRRGPRRGVGDHLAPGQHPVHDQLEHAR